MGTTTHQTAVYPVENGWEFICQTCGYRARYTCDAGGVQRLEILFVGSQEARHTSAPVETPEPSGPKEDTLPAHLILQVEAILKKADRKAR